MKHLMHQMTRNNKCMFCHDKVNNDRLNIDWYSDNNSDDRYIYSNIAANMIDNNNNNNDNNNNNKCKCDLIRTQCLPLGDISIIINDGIVNNNNIIIIVIIKLITLK